MSAKVINLFKAVAEEKQTSNSISELDKEKLSNIIDRWIAEAFGGDYNNK